MLNEKVDVYITIDSSDQFDVNDVCQMMRDEYNLTFERKFIIDTFEMQGCSQWTEKNSFRYICLSMLLKLEEFCECLK